MAERRDQPDGFARYYAATQDAAPRSTLLHALDAFAAAPAAAQARLALDLGCGAGRDTVELLRRGWRVLAIDAEAEAIAALEARPEARAHRASLEARIARFESMDLPPADMVNASFALPLCPPEAFPTLWRNIRAALTRGGRFAGQLFGPRDTWAERRPPITIHDRAALRSLFEGYEVERLEEEETDSQTPRGSTKHWHIFHVVARKP